MFTPTLPNIQADISGGPVAGLADVRNSFVNTLASAESMLPAAIAGPLAGIRTKISGALAGIEAKLPQGAPPVLKLPATGAQTALQTKYYSTPNPTGSVSRQIIETRGM